MPQVHKQYTNLASVYNLFLKREAARTWRNGIIREIKARTRMNGDVLDLGSGTGIGAELLQGCGNFSVTSVDASPEMLRLARDHSSSIVLSDISLVRSAVRKDFSTITAGFEVLNYFSEEGLAKVFRAVAHCLTPDGTFIFDYVSPSFLFHKCAGTRAIRSHGNVSLQWKYGPAQGQSVHLNLTLRRNTAIQWRERHVLYSYEVAAVTALAEGAGLKLDAVRGVYSSGFSEKHKRHVFTMSRSSQ